MSRRTLSVLATSAVLFALAFGAADSIRPDRHSPTGIAGMTDASMRQWLADYYAVHPAHGGATGAGTPADTFLVNNFIFDTDGNLATQIDTARVTVGQSVMWKLVAGFHTTTSGNPTDLNAGSHWDHAVDPSNLEFTVQFDTAGTYPFFCRPHGQFFNMRGVVVVSAALDAGPSPAVRGEGFVADAYPNPTHAGARFRFALRRPGAVTLRVLDASGRAVATVLDQRLDAGVHDATWDGRRADGGRAAAGVYYARLRGAGLDASTRIVVTR